MCLFTSSRRHTHTHTHTPPPRPQAAEATFTATKNNVDSLVASAEGFLAQMKGFTKSLESITEGFGVTMSAESGSAGGAGPLCDAAAATQVTFAFSNGAQENCIAWFETHVLAHLREKRDALVVLEETIKARNKLKEEYDYYYEKVRATLFSSFFCPVCLSALPLFVTLCLASRRRPFVASARSPTLHALPQSALLTSSVAGLNLAPACPTLRRHAGAQAAGKGQ